jgi:uncharacterized protein YjbJ (UPF0337 family)
MTDINVIKGQIKQAEGKTQELIGKATHSVEDDLAGQAKQVSGAIQEAIGHAKDQLHDELHKDQV